MEPYAYDRVKDLATYEASDQTAQAVAQKMFGGDEKIRQGYKERLDIREVLGERLAREIVLEPRATAGTSSTRILTP